MHNTLTISGTEYDITGRALVPHNLAISPKNRAGKRGLVHLLHGRGPGEYYLKTICKVPLYLKKSIGDWTFLIGEEHPEILVDCEKCLRVARRIAEYTRTRRRQATRRFRASDLPDELACTECETRFQVGNKALFSYHCPWCEEKLVEVPTGRRLPIRGFIRRNGELWD